MTTTSPWLPIETAPKDGTLVDLWVNGKRCTDCFFGHYWDEDSTEDLHWYQHYAENPGTFFPIEGVMTHWMPRPEDPPNYYDDEPDAIPHPGNDYEYEPPDA